MEMPITIFDTIKLTPFWFTLAVIAVGFLILSFAGFFWFEYNRGKPLKSLFWGRVKQWTNNKVALFEIFSPINTVRFEYAHREIGDVYKFGETEHKINTEPVKKSFWSKLFGNKVKVTTTDKSIYNEVITPKSVYTVNAVKTIPMFEPYPQLNKDIVKGCEALIAKDIYTFEDLKFMVDENLTKNQILFDNYTYEKFYELYTSSKNKFEVNISIKDVMNFMSSTFDKNFRESIEAKEFNVKQNKKNNGAQKYKTALIVCGVLVTVIMILYKVVYG